MTFGDHLDDLLGTEEPISAPLVKRGRPRIHPPKDPTLPKRPKGRPKKEVVSPPPTITKKVEIELPEFEEEIEEENEDISGEVGEEVPAPPKKRSRQTKPQHIGDWQDTRNPNGVSLTWLSNAFRMTRETVKLKLAGLPPIGSDGANSKTYDFVQAASYLVPPKVDLEEYLKGLSIKELPQNLRKETYQALILEQKYLRQAGELWHTSDVMEVYGEAMKRIKDNLQTWVERVERVEGLTVEQRMLLTTLVDELRSDMYESLLRLKDESKTLSSAETSDDEVDL